MEELNLRDHGHRFRIEAGSGKPSTLHLPFFNLAIGKSGIIGAIGWTGGWAADFCREMDGACIQALTVPTAVAAYPHELAPIVRQRAAKYYNVVQFSDFPEAGHFAIHERAEEMADDLRRFFWPLRRIATTAKH